MSNYLESTLYRYVIATLDAPTNYLIFKDGNITFTKQIPRATKTASKITANSIRNEFYAYTGRKDIDLIVLPIRISYELLKDENETKGESIDLLSW